MKNSICPWCKKRLLDPRNLRKSLGNHFHLCESTCDEELFGLIMEYLKTEPSVKDFCARRGCFIAAEEKYCSVLCQRLDGHNNLVPKEAFRECENPVCEINFLEGLPCDICGDKVHRWCSEHCFLLDGPRHMAKEHIQMIRAAPEPKEFYSRALNKKYITIEWIVKALTLSHTKLTPKLFLADRTNRHVWDCMRVSIYTAWKERNAGTRCVGLLFWDRAASLALSLSFDENLLPSMVKWQTLRSLERDYPVGNEYLEQCKAWLREPVNNGKPDNVALILISDKNLKDSITFFLKQ